MKNYNKLLGNIYYEKYDLKNTLEIMEKIKQEIITIKYVRVSEFSALARPILDYARTFAALPLTVEKSIIELVKKRLEETNNKLLCLTCGNWETVIKPKNLMNVDINCPRCRSRIVTRTYVSDMEIGKIIKKKQKKKKRRKETKKKRKRKNKKKILRKKQQNNFNNFNKIIKF